MISFGTDLSSKMFNIITTETIREGGGGIKNPDQSDGKIKIGKSPLKRKGGKK
jgi:hypothetical protein